MASSLLYTAPSPFILSGAPLFFAVVTINQFDVIIYYRAVCALASNYSNHSTIGLDLSYHNYAAVVITVVQYVL